MTYGSVIRFALSETIGGKTQYEESADWNGSIEKGEICTYLKRTLGHTLESFEK